MVVEAGMIAATLKSVDVLTVLAADPVDYAIRRAAADAVQRAQRQAAESDT